MNTVNTNLPVFNIDAFVIPNPSFCYDSNYGNSICGCGDYHSMKNFVDNCEALGRLGINPYSWNRGGVDGLNIRIEDHWVQLWMHNSECDNLNDHGITDDMMKVMGDMPNGELNDSLISQFVPEKFLSGVKEGDTKETVITKWSSEAKDWVPVAKIHWTFKQQGYRYARFGNFEDVVALVLNRGKSFRKEKAAA